MPIMFVMDRRAVLLLLGAVVLAAVIGVSVSFFIPREYSASVVLLPAKAERSSGLSSLVGQVGGLASLAGIELGGDDDSSEALATLRSRALVVEFIEERALMPVLFPARWDEASGAWREGIFGGTPTLGDAYRKFDRRIRSVSEDRRTGIVTLTIRWRDPQVAADWANDLAGRVNRKMRERATAEAQASLSYLNSELGKTQVVELREPIYRLIVHRLNTVMLANVRQEYAFRIIDPAMPPDADHYSSPLHWLFALGGAALGAMIGAAMVIRRRPGLSPVA